MKKIIFLLIFILLNSFSFSQKLQSYLAYSSFISPENGPYFETYLSLEAENIVFIKNLNGNYQGSVEITMLFKQNDSIKNHSKYNLSSPERKDSSDKAFNFIDQQRFLLKEGFYYLEINIRDLNKADNEQIINFPLYINYPKDSINISGIELLEKYSKTITPNILTKNGYDLVPYPSDFYPDNLNNFIFYAEVYNTNKFLGENQKFLLKYFIESFETGKPINEYVINSRETSMPIIVLLREFNISKLPSGNYNLVIEVRNASNQILATNRVFFQRSNPSVQYDLSSISAININETFVSSISSSDSLKYYIRSLKPISTQLEFQYAQNLIKASDLTNMQQYMYNFWLSRNNVSTEQEWITYRTQVKAVEKSFGSKFKRGFDSDRGRVYLKYGSPNSITDVPFETSSLSGEGSVPYQIWHYYSAAGQGSRKFVFYNPTLSLNDYELIHSDAVGEVSNYNWQSLIRYRKKGEKHGDAPFGNQKEKYQGKSGEYYDLPR